MFTQNLPPLSGLDLQVALKLSENVLSIMETVGNASKTKLALKEIHDAINEANNVKSQSSENFAKAAEVLASSEAKLSDLAKATKEFNERKLALEFTIESELKVKQEVAQLKSELELKEKELELAKNTFESSQRSAIKLLKEKEQEAVEQKLAFEKLNSELSAKLEKLKELTA